ncbi:glycosyltransferase involved in cell wall biosynthesis [Rhodopirellula rubra]|uniref:Glycosyltransferase involved in cell wall biosynthesis n=1 Tax=Aporhodopirellula rubra TaxID=980271 RepID=A0A7W5DXC5_9BACT|nr:glycosyltransferase family 4 protein [Aporhodopirellula rubra]MBB3206279.1 glycosyltransferase involved in cell wall biosynthesis [Aporhodopirellula rubra]
MRVVFVTHYSTLYGANRSLLGLLDGLSRSQVHPLVVLPPSVGDEPGLHEELRTRGIETIEADVPIQFATSKKLPSIWSPIRRRRWKATTVQNIDQRSSISVAVLVNRLQSSSIDLVYSNTAATRFGKVLADGLGTPHVWHLREFAENYDMHFAHGMSDFRKQLATATEVVAISHAVAKRLAGSRLASRCHVIYNGVGTPKDFESLSRRRKQRKPNSLFRFLLLGQILPSKGHEQVLAACEYLAKVSSQSFQVRVVGSGKTDWLNEKIARSTCRDLVDLNGPTDAPFEEIVNADCLLMCSPLEAMGRVTAEAMVCGCPVIGYDACGTSELIQHERTGLLYRGGAKQLAKSMLQLMTDDDIRSRLAESARQSAIVEFSNENYSSKVLAVIENALKRQETVPS